MPATPAVTGVVPPNCATLTLEFDAMLGLVAVANAGEFRSSKTAEGNPLV
jgi:hypothetical protein